MRGRVSAALTQIGENALMPEGRPTPGPAPEPGLGGIEEQYHILMECVADHALLLLDPEGRVAAWNAGAERLLGYREEEILGRHFARFFTPQDVAAGQPGKE